MIRRKGVETVGDRIIYNGDAMERAISGMEQMSKLLLDVSKRLSQVDTSEEWWSRLQVGEIMGASNALSALDALSRATNTAAQDAATIRSGIRAAKDIFERAETEVLAMAKDLVANIGKTSTGGTGAEASADPGTEDG